MPLSDDDEKKLRDELTQLQKEKKELEDAVKATKANDTEKERQKAAANGKPDNLKLDADVVKELAETKQRVAEIEKALGKKKGSGSFGMLNLFGED